MGETLAQLVQEFGARFDNAFVSTPSSAASSSTQYIDTLQLERLPNVVSSGLNWWIYGGLTADVNNRGIERRISNWNTNGQFAIYAPGFTDFPSTGQYEIHPRVARSRKVKAINSAVGKLGLIYWRSFEDMSIVTSVAASSGTPGQSGGWEYNLEHYLTGIKIAEIKSVDIEIATDSFGVAGGYPYVPATQWNWDVRVYTDSVGNETHMLQFGIQPPPGRTLRIRGEAYATQLVLDSDVLPISGKWEQDAMEWIFDWAAYLLNQNSAQALPMGEAQRWRQAEFDRLQTAKEKLLLSAPTHANSQIAVPGHGDGLYSFNMLGDQAMWLGANRSTHVYLDGAMSPSMGHLIR